MAFPCFWRPEYPGASPNACLIARNSSRSPRVHIIKFSVRQVIAPLPAFWPFRMAYRVSLGRISAGLCTVGRVRHERDIKISPDNEVRSDGSERFRCSVSGGGAGVEGPAKSSGSSEQIPPVDRARGK